MFDVISQSGIFRVMAFYSGSRQYADEERDDSLEERVERLVSEFTSSYGRSLLTRARGLCHTVFGVGPNVEGKARCEFAAEAEGSKRDSSQTAGQQRRFERLAKWLASNAVKGVPDADPACLLALQRPRVHGPPAIRRAKRVSRFLRRKAPRLDNARTSTTFYFSFGGRLQQ
jgi:hypothetical protein